MKVTILSPTKTVEEGTAFYKTKEWKELRKLFLSQQTELKCKCCGIEVVNAPKIADIPEHQGKEVANVDHILPVRYYWDDRLSIDNLQLLCKSCNKRKGNRQGPNILKEVYEEIQLDKREQEILRKRDQRLLTWKSQNEELYKLLEEDFGYEYNVKNFYDIKVSKESFVKLRLQTYSEPYFLDNDKYLRKVKHFESNHKKKINKNNNKSKHKNNKKPIKKGNTLIVNPVAKPGPRVHLVPRGTMTKKI